MPGQFPAGAPSRPDPFHVWVYAACEPGSGHVGEPGHSAGPAHVDVGECTRTHPRSSRPRWFVADSGLEHLRQAALEDNAHDAGDAQVDGQEPEGQG